MDFEQDFLATVQEVVQQLVGRGIAPSTFTFDGQTIQGWVIDSTSHDDLKGSPGSGGYWEEYWDRGQWVLRDDSTFWECGFWGSEASTGKKEREEWMRAIPLSRFVGSEGKPFSKWKAKLERLPYTWA